MFSSTSPGGSVSAISTGNNVLAHPSSHALAHELHELLNSRGIGTSNEKSVTNSNSGSTLPTENAAVVDEENEENELGDELEDDPLDTFDVEGELSEPKEAEDKNNNVDMIEQLNTQAEKIGEAVAEAMQTLPEKDASYGIFAGELVTSAFAEMGKMGKELRRLFELSISTVYKQRVTRMMVMFTAYLRASNVNLRDDKWRNKEDAVKNQEKLTQLLLAFILVLWKNDGSFGKHVLPAKTKEIEDAFKEKPAKALSWTTVKGYVSALRFGFKCTDLAFINPANGSLVEQLIKGIRRYQMRDRVDVPTRKAPILTQEQRKEFDTTAWQLIYNHMNDGNGAMAIKLLCALTEMNSMWLIATRAISQRRFKNKDIQLKHDGFTWQIVFTELFPKNGQTLFHTPSTHLFDVSTCPVISLAILAYVLGEKNLKTASEAMFFPDVNGSSAVISQVRDTTAIMPTPVRVLCEKVHVGVDNVPGIRCTPHSPHSSILRQLGQLGIEETVAANIGGWLSSAIDSYRSAMNRDRSFREALFRRISFLREDTVTGTMMIPWVKKPRMPADQTTTPIPCGWKGILEHCIPILADSFGVQVQTLSFATEEAGMTGMLKRLSLVFAARKIAMDKKDSYSQRVQETITDLKTGIKALTGLLSGLHARPLCMALNASFTGLNALLDAVVVERLG